MKREIKFRGKIAEDIEALEMKSGYWFDGHYVREGNQHFIVVDDEDQMYLKIFPETLGQFTGLLDKTGKEIYEGDILRGDKYPFNCDGVDNYFAEIVWCDNVCGFYRRTHKSPNSLVRGISHGDWELLDEDDIKFFEVIGNIHDNQELLKTE